MSLYSFLYLCLLVLYRLIGGARIAAVSSAERVVAFQPKTGQAVKVLLSVLPDTGAEVDAIPDWMFKKYVPKVVLSQCDPPLVTAIGSDINTLGSFDAIINWIADDGEQRPVETTIHFLCRLGLCHQLLLSRITQMKLDMLPSGFPPSISPTVEPVDRKSTHPTREEDLRKLQLNFPTVCDGICRAMNGAKTPIQADGQHDTSSDQRIKTNRRFDDGADTSPLVAPSLSCHVQTCPEFPLSRSYPLSHSSKVVLCVCLNTDRSTPS